MCKRLLRSKTGIILLSIILVLAGIVLVLSGSIYGMSTCDSPYMLFNVREPERGPIAMLTFWIAHQWCDVFGFSIGSLSWLKSVTNLIAFGIGSLWFALTTRRYFRGTAMFFVTCCLGELCSASYFNWDTAVYPWYVINAILALEYLRRPTTVKILLMGFFTAVITVARIPAGICCLIDFGIVIYVWSLGPRSFTRLLVQAFSGMTVFCITVLALGLVMCHSISGYFDCFVPENFINGHFDLKSIYFRFYSFIPVTAMWGGTLVLIGGAFFAAKSTCNRWLKLVIILLSYNICWNTVRLVLASNFGSFCYGLGQMLFIGTIIVSYFQNRSAKGEERNNAALIVLMVYSLANLLGSDTPAEKMLALPLLPLALTYVNFNVKSIKRTVNLLMVELAIMGFYHQFYTFYSIKNGLYYKCDSLPNIGLQYLPEDDMWAVGWAVDAKPVNDQAIEAGLRVGYMGALPMMGEGFLGENNPSWMNEFWVYLDDEEQRKQFDDYFKSCDCIFYPSDRSNSFAGNNLIDDFVDGSDYKVFEVSDRCLVAVSPEKVKQVEILLSNRM